MYVVNVELIDIISASRCDSTKIGFYKQRCAERSLSKVNRVVVLFKPWATLTLTQIRIPNPNPKPRPKV